METVFEDPIQAIMNEINKLKNIMYDLKQELRNTRINLLHLVRTQHNEQLKQIEACQEAFKMNVERDEDLMTALSEAHDPWNGWA